MNRRQFLKLGAVTGGVFELGGAMRIRGRSAFAQSTTPPIVDRLVMTNVVDNIYDVFAKAGKLDTITVERIRGSIGVPSPAAEHGLAYHLESTRGSDRREILLDFSLTERTLFHNYAVLKLDPSRADALIISHGHADHYGALPDWARIYQGKFKSGVTLYAGGEDTFCHRMITLPTGGTFDYGRLDQAGLEARGLKVVLAKQATSVVGHAFTTGQIPRLTDFERPPAAARLVAGAMDSACSSAHFGATKVEATPGELVVDTFQGEHATAYHVKDRGLVVITSCGHAGVINSVRQARKVAGVEEVHAIVGGCRLAPAPGAIVQRAAAACETLRTRHA